MRISPKILVSFLCFFMIHLNLSGIYAIEIEIQPGGSDLKVISEKDVSGFFGRGLPMGPASMRFFHDSLWISNSVEGNFLEFKADGKLVKKIEIPEGKKFVFSDFAFQSTADNRLEAIWTVGSEQTDILKISLNGEVVKRFDTILMMPCQIELVANSQLVVFDEGNDTIVSFDFEGKKLWEQKAAGKKFLVTPDNEILFIDKAGESLCISIMNPTTLAVKKEKDIPVNEDGLPSLLAFSPDSDILFSFQTIDVESDSFFWHIGRLSRGDQKMESLTMNHPAPFLNRILIPDSGQILIVDFVEGNEKSFFRITDFDAKFSDGNSEG
ncbi:MAG: YncE family protein [Candidatus Rifleibacteriota bacterium]